MTEVRTPIPVVVVSSSPVTRSGLRAVLEREPILVLVDDAERADVAVIDRLMGTASSRLLAYDDRPARVLLVGAPEHELIVSALRAGVRGIVSADASGAEIAAAILAVREGLLAVPAAFAESLIGAFRPRPSAAEDRVPLTPREREVLQLIGEGHSNKTIAQRLSISEHTAKFHVSAVLGKLGVETRTDAVRLGIKSGLIAL